jgi:hypothetical protein
LLAVDLREKYGEQARRLHEANAILWCKSL